MSDPQAIPSATHVTGHEPPRLTMEQARKIVALLKLGQVKR